MPNPVCTATVAVLNRIRFTNFGTAVEFQTLTDEPDEHPGKVLIVPMWAWRDLGSPDQITVTVEPGDKLNS